PSTRIEARMVLTSSYGATCWFTVRGSTTRPPSRASASRAKSTVAPSSPSSLMVVTTSFRCGTLRISTGASASRVGRRMGNAEFLAPELVTSPWSGSPPLTTILCMAPGVPDTCIADSADAGLGAGRFVGREALARQGVDGTAHQLDQGGVDPAG